MTGEREDEASLEPRAEAEPAQAAAPEVVASEIAAPAPAVAIPPAEEPEEGPPPVSVPRPPPPVALKTYVRPMVHELSPSNGSVLGGTKVTFAGDHLFRVTIVRIGGVIAQTVGADEPRELRVLTPSVGGPGEVAVSLENPFVPPLVLPKAFRYEPLAPPAIVSVAPDHVATRGGAELTVTGKGFVKGSVVLFDGKPAPSVRFVNATTLDVTTPPGEHGKLVDVSVKNPDGATATAPRAFLYDERFG